MKGSKIENTKKVLEEDARILSEKCLEGKVNFKKKVKGKNICFIANENYPFFGVERFCEYHGNVVVIEKPYKNKDHRGIFFKRYYECLRRDTNPIKESIIKSRPMEYGK